MEFIDLLNNKDRRMLILLHELVKNGSISIDELLARISVTKKTLLKTVDELNQFDLTDSNKSIIHIDKNRIYILENLNPALLVLYKKVVHHSIPSIILTKLFHMETPSINQLAEECASSSVIIYKQIKALNRFLELYDIQIKLSPLRLSGSEEQIRFFYKHFFWYIFHGIDWPFKNVTESELTNLIQLQAPFLIPPKSNTIKESILFDIAIILSRRRNQQFISRQITYYPDSPLNKVIYSAGSFQNIDSPKTYHFLEKSYSMALLETDSPVSDEPSLMQEMLFFYQQEDSTFYRMMMTLMEIFREKLTKNDFQKIDIIPFKMKIIRLFFRIFYFKGEKNSLFPFLNEEETENSFLTHLLEFSIVRLLHSFPELDKNAQILYTRLKTLLSSNLSFTSYLPTVTILLDIDTEPLREHISHQIQSLDYNCIFLDHPSISAECDLLISNSILPSIECDEAFIFSHKKLTNYDCTLLNQRLAQITKTKIDNIQM
ncbi:helix-turn-helix domain-containing protein [Listeria floridensis]|uniref:helix-turn-helix domain-containing protein n=1 Tax=Listeria floridensis TaxID=1494962 RepID=UPI0004B2902C|nr:helix-turn-helix domain-containing protein [Listeria floridensis]